MPIWHENAPAIGWPPTGRTEKVDTSSESMSTMSDVVTPTLVESACCTAPSAGTTIVTEGPVWSGPTWCGTSLVPPFWSSPSATRLPIGVTQSMSPPAVGLVVWPTTVGVGCCCESLR